MSHSSVDRSTFLIYQFLINLGNVIINRIHFNFNNKIKTVTTQTQPERNKTEAQGSSSQCSMIVLDIRKRGGGLYPGGLITGCIFLFTGRWAYNQRGL